MNRRNQWAAALLAAVVAVLFVLPGTSLAIRSKVAPHYEVDPTWPKPLPDNMLVGQVAGIAVDRDDNVWIVQRPRSLTADEAGAAQTPPLSECCYPAPSVIKYDSDGNVLQMWGGPDWWMVDDGTGHSMMEDPATGAIADWMDNEHGIFVDHNMNVWLPGQANSDHIVYKFSASGRLLLVIGEKGVTGGDCDFAHLGRPADTEVDPETNEVYVADGYGNHRVIVFDADTGAYKRHWFANGVTACSGGSPDYPAGVTPYSNPVHAVRIADDGLLYVADRVGNRIQVFRKDHWGQADFYRGEVSIAPATLGPGSVWDLDLSPDWRQTFLFNADGSNNHIWVLRRANLEILSTFGRNGRMAGEFHWVHNLAVDSRGNMYTAEVDTGKRAQKFVLRGHRRVR